MCVGGGVPQSMVCVWGGGSSIYGVCVCVGSSIYGGGGFSTLIEAFTWFKCITINNIATRII